MSTFDDDYLYDNDNDIDELDDMMTMAKIEQAPARA